MSSKTRALTVKGKGGLLRMLKTDMHFHVPGSSTGAKVKGIWDTGATSTVITESVVKSLGLIATGVVEMHTANGIATNPTYTVDISFEHGLLIEAVQVSAVKALSAGCDALIGMDIITLGDFSITNHNGITCMSFQVPSFHEIDYVTNPLVGLPKKVALTTTSNPYAGISRNAECPCGSKKKFKHCHGK